MLTGFNQVKRIHACLTVVIVASSHVAKFQSHRIAGHTMARIVTSIESAIYNTSIKSNFIARIIEKT